MSDKLRCSYKIKKGASVYKVEYGVKGAMTIKHKTFDTLDDALYSAARWASSNSQGSYWAVVTKDGQDVRKYNLG